MERVLRRAIGSLKAKIIIDCRTEKVVRRDRFAPKSPKFRQDNVLVTSKLSFSVMGNYKRKKAEREHASDQEKSKIQEKKK